MTNPNDGEGRSSGAHAGGDGRVAGTQAGGTRLPGGMVSLQAREVLRGSENYNSWAFSTKMVLIKERTWCAVKDRNEGDPEISEELSEQALATICLNIDRSIYGLVQNAKTAKEAWDNLRNTFEDSGSTRKIGLLRRLTGIRLVGAERDDDVICQSPQEYVNEIMLTCNQLAEVGFKVDDTWMCSLLLKGLPKKYDPMIMGLESSGVALTADIVKAKIMQEVKVKGGSKSSESEGAFFSKQNVPKKQVDKGGVKCFRCKKLGHFASECQKEASGEKKKDKRSTPKGNAAFFAAHAVQSTERSDSDWFFDSGATTHLCRNKNVLENPQDVSSRINVANNAEVAVVAKGSVKLEAECGDATWDLTMSDVLCVPDLAINLLSVSKVCQKGFRVVFSKEECEVVNPDDEVVAIGREVGGLYKLIETKKPVVNLVKDDKYELWHRRMGHLAAGGMKQLKTMVTGLDFEMENPARCIPCIEGKHSRQPFKSKGHREERVLELIHSDLCGPMETTSIGGSRYFLTFIDDASRKTVVYFLKSKTEVLEALQDYKAFAEKQTGEKIKRIRTDNGKEYVNQNFRSFLRKEGIQHETSAPYNPEQNGLAERMNRTLTERAKSMLFDANLDNRFWAEAVAVASHVVNRSPTKGLSVTPEEKFSGKRPDVSHLRIFGAEVMVHVPKEKRKKWDRKSEACIFVGYSEGSKAYRVYSKKTKKIFVSRDVIFLNECQLKRSETTEEPSNEDAEGRELVIQNERVEVADQTEPTEADDEPEDDAAGENVLDETVYNDVDSIDDEEPQPSVLPPQPEDPQLLVRRSAREHTVPGKYRDYIMSCNTFPESGSQSEQIHSVETEGEPATLREALARNDSDRWKEAMLTEYEAQMENQTWELVELPNGRKPLRCKWVYKLKTNSDGSVERYKARLVIKGFSQVHGIDYTETYAPVVRYASIRYLMSMAAKMNLKIHQLDAVSAFLQGDLEEEEIYMEQPDGFVNPAAPTKVCRLKKALYGLKQASRVWNQKLDAELKRIGLKRSAYDRCVYFKIEAGMVLIVAVYVDDMLVFSNNQRWVDRLKKQLMTKFRMKDLGLASKILGMRVTRDGSRVMVDQERYVDCLLKRFNVADCNVVATPADPNQKLTKEMCPSTEEDRKQMENVPFRELVGSLQYLVQSTRPDISFAVNMVSQFCQNPGKAHWIAAKRILRYLKGTKSMKLTYSKKSDEGFVGYSDADWANDPETRRSITGYVFKQAGGAISWSCRKQATVALSTMEAEYMAVSAATQEAMWWRGLREELHGVSEAIPIRCDNLSAVHLAKKEVGYSPRSKHIDIRHHYVREKLEQKMITLQHVGTQEQVADVLTKAIPISKLKEAKETLGIK